MTWQQRLDESCDFFVNFILMAWHPIGEFVFFAVLDSRGPHNTAFLKSKGTNTELHVSRARPVH